MRRTTCLRLGSAGAFLALIAGGVPTGAAAGGVDLISVSRSGVSADDHARDASISHSGAHVAFSSTAGNLSRADRRGTRDVFLRNTRTGRTMLISRARGARGAAARGNSSLADVSDDGLRVAFRSNARNLSAIDRDRVSDIFVRDLRTRRTILVTRVTGPRGRGADGDSFELSISGSGRYVAFASNADNLSDEDDNDRRNIFVRDIRSGRTTLVSRATGPSGASADANSHAPSISDDGRYVAFASRADNLSDEDDDSVINIFVRDLGEKTTTLVSRDSGASGAPVGRHTYRPTISGDGRTVAFDTMDGLDGEIGGISQVYARDLASGTTTLVSRRLGPADTFRAGGDDHSNSATLSRDGTRVAFMSAARDLTGVELDDPFFAPHAYLHDLTTGRTQLVSRGRGARGRPADGLVFSPAISGNGRYVAFDSHSRNLSPTHRDRDYDVFRRQVAP